MTQRVLVTGSNGRLGSLLVDRLNNNGFDVVAMVRPDATGPAPRAVEVVAADVRVRNQVDPLVKRVDLVINAATDPAHRSVDLEGTQQLAYACTEKEVPLIQPSLVGIEDSSRRYHRTKLRAEQIIERVPGLEWTIARSTQFHVRIDEQLDQPICMLPASTPFQPADAREFAARIVGLALAGPSRRVAEFGGPEIATLEQLAAVRKEIVGSAARFAPVPPFGSAREIAEGAHVMVGGDRGMVSYRDWLSLRA